MSDRSLNRWVLKFGKHAAADECALFRDHLRGPGLPDEPALLLEGALTRLRYSS